MGMVIARYSKPRAFLLAAALVAAAVFLIWVGQRPKSMSSEGYLSAPGQTPIDGIVEFGKFFAPALILVALAIGYRLSQLLVRAILVSDGLLLYFPIYADGFFFKGVAIPLEDVERIFIGRMPFPLWPMSGLVLNLTGGRRKGVPTCLLAEACPAVLSQLQEALAERTGPPEEARIRETLSRFGARPGWRRRRR